MARIRPRELVPRMHAERTTGVLLTLHAVEAQPKADGSDGDTGTSLISVGSLPEC